MTKAMYTTISYHSDLCIHTIFLTMAGFTYPGGERVLVVKYTMNMHAKCVNLLETSRINISESNREGCIE